MMDPVELCLLIQKIVTVLDYNTSTRLNDYATSSRLITWSHLTLTELFGAVQTAMLVLVKYIDRDDVVH